MSYDINDRGYYFFQGLLISEGHFFKNGLLYQQTGQIVDTAAHPPGFPLLLGLWSALGFTTVIAQQFLMCAVGGATVVAIAILTRRLAGNTAGIIAAIIATLHPLLWFNDASLLSESLYQLVIACVIISAYSYISNPCYSRILLAGVLVGVAVHVRTEAVLLAPFLLFPLIWTTCKNSEQLSKHMLIGAAAVIAVLSPWIAYINIIYDKPVGLISSTGMTLLHGSCDATWHGDGLGHTYSSDAGACFWNGKTVHGDNGERIKAQFPEMTRFGAELHGNPTYDASQINSFLRSLSLEYILDNLSRYPIVMLARVARMFGVYRPIDTMVKEYNGSGSSWYESIIAGQILYLLLVIPTAHGTWIQHRQRQRLIPLLAMWPMVAIAAAVTFAVPRYRVPVDIAMIVLASIAFSHWFTVLDRRWNNSNPSAAPRNSSDATRGSRIKRAWATRGSERSAAA